MEVQIEMELTKMVKTVFDTGLKPVWPTKLFTLSILNVLWMLVAGEILDSNDDRLNRFFDIMSRRNKAFTLTGGILSHIPWLRHIAPNWTGYNLITSFNKELYDVLMETINAHKADYDDEKSRDDLIYAYLKEMKEQKSNVSSNYTELQLTMVILDLFLAGFSTVNITFDLAFMTLVLYPDIQKRIHKDIESTLTGPPTSADRNRLPYIEAYVLEILRYYSMLPLGGLRRALEETTLGGYTIPKNTTIVTGLRAVHMDAEHWGDPEVFRPERFLDENMQIVNTERLVQFGGGRRVCLGQQLARNCLFVFFTGILQKFTVELPPKDAGYPPPDPVLIPGIHYMTKEYKVVFRPK